jgi:hypothetical protein
MATTYPLPLPSVRVWVAGVDRTATGEVMASTIQVRQILGAQVDSASFSLFPPSSWRTAGGSLPTVGQSVLIEVQNGTGQPFVARFGGSISHVTQVKVGPGAARWDIQCVDYTNLLAQILVNKTYVGWEVSDIVRDVVRQYAPQVIIDANVMDTATILDHVSFAFVYPLAVVQQLAQIVTYEFYVDATLVLHFYPAGTTTQASAESVTNTSQNYDNLSIEPQLDQVRNRIFVQGGAASSTPVIDQWDADGQTTVFPLAHDNVVATLTISGASPFMTIDGVAQRVGLAGVVDESTFAGGFILEPGNNAHVRTPVGTDTIPDGSRVVFSYQWQVPISVMRESQPSQAAVAALDGTAYSTVVLGDSPIFYWRLDEASGSRIANSAATGVTFSGMLTGNATLGIAGVIHADTDTALDLAGGRILMVSGAKIPTSNGSLEAWVRTSTFQTGSTLPDGSPAYRDAGIVGQWDTAFARGGAALWVTSGGTYGLAYDQNYPTNPPLVAFAASGQPTGTNWDHVVGTWQTVGISRVRSLYVNNTLVAQDSVLLNPGTVPGSGIEIGNYNYDTGSHRLLGSLDEVAVYAYALSGTQIAEHYNAALYGGVRDYAVNDTSLTSFAVARARGDLELARWSNVVTVISFDSWVPTWKVGDSVPVVVTPAVTGFTFSGTALVQELDVGFVGAERARYSVQCQATRFNFLDYQQMLLGVQAQAVQQGQVAALNLIELDAATTLLVVPGSVTATVNTPPFHVAPDWGSGTTPYIVASYWVVDPTLY